MPTELASFAFIITLAAVINGLGIVRWLTGFAEYLRQSEKLSVTPYWVYMLFAGFQFLLHILMWWSLWSVRGAGEINFLMYMYLLSGPILLFLGTSVLAPDISQGSVDMKTHYYAVRATYSTILTLLWLWAIFLSPLLRDTFASSLPMYGALLASAVIQRISADPRAQAGAAISSCLLLLLFIGMYSMKLGGAAA
jgi:hypothetical protein